MHINLTRIQNFIATLGQFNNRLSSDWSSMEAAWNRAARTWNDQKRNEFERDWKEVQGAMRGYLNRSTQYMQFLRGREGAVREYLGK